MNVRVRGKRKWLRKRVGRVGEKNNEDEKSLEMERREGRQHGRR